jgi:hypothetical protein
MLIKPASTKQFLEELEKIKAAISDIYRWAETHVVADDVFPREFPRELNDFIHVAFSSCEALVSKIRTLDDEETRLLYDILVKCQRHEKLSEEEYYLCRAMGDLKPKCKNENEYEAYLRSLP